MPANGYSVGRDVTLDIVDPLRGILRFSIKTGWSSEPMYTELTSKGLDGTNRFADIPEGWTLKFDLDRGDAAVDSYFAAQEALYFAGGVVPYVSVTETIVNPDGTLSQFRYTGIAMRITNAGSWKSDAKVEQSISGRAQRRLQVL